MPLNLLNHEEQAKEAIKVFWRTRGAAIKKQAEKGRSDQGNRSAVTSGKNMDGFLSIAMDIIRANGLPDAEIALQRRVLTLPGFFRPTKLWDMLVFHEGKLVAALELKSQVGPSFGNNFNNRTEEAIGTAHDLWTAYREGAFGKNAPRPFIGWLMLLEDAPQSRSPVRDAAPHFPVFPEFHKSSYSKRYEILCRKLIQENLYTSACLITSPKSGIDDGAHQSLSELTSLKSFLAQLAGHVAAAGN